MLGVFLHRSLHPEILIGFEVEQSKGFYTLSIIPLKSKTAFRFHYLTYGMFIILLVYLEKLLKKSSKLTSQLN